MGMNDTEKKAYRWLLKQGFKKEEIKFQYGANPDFITEKGGYEAKTLTLGKYVTFTKAQTEDFKESDVTILVFSEEQEPIAIGTFNEIQSKFHCYTVRNVGKIMVSLSEGLEKKLRRKVKEDYADKRGAISIIIEKALENYLEVHK